LGFVVAIISGNSDTPMYLLAVMTLAVGIFLWFRTQKKYKRNVQEYKALISKTLDL
jgi:preprotein translocase subunit YajC